jgi:hypothetical protein
VNDNVQKVCRHPTRYDFADWNHRNPSLLIENFTGMNAHLKILIGRSRRTVTRE